MAKKDSRQGAFFVTLLGELILNGLGAITGIILARLLGPVGRGELAAIVLWPTFIQTIGGLGVPQSIAYFVAARPKEVKKIYINSSILAIFQSVALILIGLIIIPIVLKREFAHIIPLSLIYLISIPFSLIAGIHRGILQGFLWMGKHNLQRLLPAGLYLSGLLIFLIYGEAGLGSMVVLLLIILIISAFLSLWLIREKIAFLFSFDWKLLREIYLYGLKTQTGQALYELNFRLDQLIMSMFLSPQNLGYYVVAVTFSGILAPFSLAVGTVALPDIASRGKDDQIMRIVTILRMNFLVILILAVGLVIITPWALPMLFGKKFISATITAQILILGAAILGLNHVLTQGMLGIKRPSIPAFAQTLSLGVMLILLYLLMPPYGIVGAAIASVITYAVTFTILWSYLTKITGLSIGALLPRTGDCRMLLTGLSRLIRRKDLGSSLEE